jgi:tryptophanyl-tRNA synthetase
MFNAHKVPVGRDQIQHLEMARDIAQRFSHLYGNGRELFTLPDAVVDESVATLPGLDGRKMSKSYNNTIPLFEGGSKHLRESINRIVTDSRLPGEAKDAEGSQLYTLYRAFASEAESAAFRAALEGGMGWGDAKQALYERIEQDVAPMRERYVALVARPDDIEDILLMGARKARALAGPFLAELRSAVGLNPLRKPADEGKKKKGAKQARFVSFREEGGSFRFRFLAADGEDLLLSQPFADAHGAGDAIKQVRTLADPSVLVEADSDSFVLKLGGAAVARGAAYADPAARDAALDKLRAELKALAAE